MMIFSSFQRGAALAQRVSFGAMLLACMAIPSLAGAQEAAIRKTLKDRIPDLP